MIRAVTFDFWQTLADDTAEGLATQRGLRLSALRAALRDGGLSLDADAVEAGYERSQALLEGRFWDRHRDPGFAEQVGLVLECVAPGAATRVVGAGLDALHRGYAEPVLECPPALCPGAADAVRGLAARGIVLGIVSNTGRTPGSVLRRYIERQGLLGYFTTLSFSDEVGVRKPEAEIFRRTLAKLGSAPGETAHVGDNPIADVEGAGSLGLRAVHYTAGRRPLAAGADLVVADLATLPDRLAAL